MKKIPLVLAIVLLTSVFSINVTAYDNPMPFYDQNKKEATPPASEADTERGGEYGTIYALVPGGLLLVLFGAVMIVKRKKGKRV